MFKKMEEENKPEEKPVEEVEKKVVEPEEPKVVIPTAAPKEDKSFFEIMWEREHPEEVKKMALAQE